MSKLEAVKCRTSYLTYWLVTNTLVIAFTVIFTTYHYQKFSQGILWAILIFIVSLAVSSFIIHRKVMSLLNNDELWGE